MCNYIYTGLSRKCCTVKILVLKKVINWDISDPEQTRVHSVFIIFRVLVQQPLTTEMETRLQNFSSSSGLLYSYNWSFYSTLAQPAHAGSIGLFLSFRGRLEGSQTCVQTDLHICTFPQKRQVCRGDGRYQQVQSVTGGCDRVQTFNNLVETVNVK